ncbi:helix-turn-helix transcriptional regulator [Hamadaea sp. NPDC051192]|uniref:helix-turn-helix domain-containing protein n=1 Tax=Hamadaea sp. NPDC051192 TaxID=3154940 RepID=UPI0034496B54
MADAHLRADDAAARQLATRLRQQREQAQLSADELASRIGITAADVETIENGDQLSPRQLVYAWLNACGLLGPERRDIMDIVDKPH